MDEKWYITRDGKTKYGPFRREKLKEMADFGRLQPTDRVWSSGNPVHVHASKVTPR